MKSIFEICTGMLPISYRNISKCISDDVKLGHDWARLHATALDYNRVASFGANVLMIRRNATGQKLKCSESEKLVKTGRL
jgi:hypothetical protein